MANCPLVFALLRWLTTGQWTEQYGQPVLYHLVQRAQKVVQLELFDTAGITNEQCGTDGENEPQELVRYGHRARITLMVQVFQRSRERTLQHTGPVLHQVYDQSGGETGKDAKTGARSHIEHTRHDLGIGAPRDQCLQASSKQVQYDLVVHRARNARTLTKGHTATNEATEQTLQSVGHAQVASTQEAQGLVHDDKRSQVATMVEHVFHDFAHLGSIELVLVVQNAVDESLEYVGKPYASSGNDTVAISSIELSIDRVRVSESERAS